jgi:hypothetical protein
MNIFTDKAVAAANARAAQVPATFLKNFQFHVMLQT